MRSTKYCYGDQVKEDETGEARSTHERDEKFLKNLDRGA